MPVSVPVSVSENSVGGRVLVVRPVTSKVAVASFSADALPAVHVTAPTWRTSMPVPPTTT